MVTDKESKKLLQPSDLLKLSASLSSLKADSTRPIPQVFGASTQLPANTVARQGLRLSFFFDGTGNNLDADYGTREHSNVARLFIAHQHDDVSLAVGRYYIPGLGTRFKDINDPGGTTTGLAFGGMGEERLEWAMKKLETQLSSASGRTVHVALFGFSRGAALARAFARRIAERCTPGASGWSFNHKNTQTPFKLYFMGLFDTVASVGTPMGTNNLQSIDLTAGALDLEQALRARSIYGSTLKSIAFAQGGAPGADPASGPSNGHMAWADDLRIPDMVEDCVHMIAAHEIRNSFPVDSLLQGARYPKNCREMVYPGAHSDVGGGYRKGEGARSPVAGSFLSLIPLRHMRTEALRAGVPLKTELAENAKEDFAEDPASKAAFQVLCRRFDLYMRSVGRTSGPLGEVMLAHSKVFLQWRFFRAASDDNARGRFEATRDRPMINQFEPVWRQEERSLKKQMDGLEKEYKDARATAQILMESRATMFAQGRKEFQIQAGLAAQKQDEFLTRKAIYDTLPGSDGSFAHNSRLYDWQLLADAQQLQTLAKQRGRDRLRPHYFALLLAYEAEFERKGGMRDEEQIAFFDTYVHDSLAGFARDATLPSDPRVIYTGGDDKLRYAVNQSPRQGVGAQALG